MNFIFFDNNQSVVDAFQKYLSPYGTVLHGSFDTIKCDAIVSPANSFGFMDGGIDLAYSHFFGWDVQAKLQLSIKDKWYGELPIGCAQVVSTDHPNIPYLISAPTMRVPMNIRNTVNVYSAMIGILEATRGYETIRTIAVPGLGTGCGGMNPDTMAFQISKALESREFPESWQEATQKHNEILRGPI